MLSKYKNQLDKLIVNNPSVKKLYDEYEHAETEQQKRELQNKIVEILEKTK